MHNIILLLNHYGYIVLLVSLIFELIAFPLPGEMLMTYCGFLVNQQKLSYFPSILIATAGAILGITASYFLGKKVGITFFEKYGHYVHLGPEKLEKTSKWFNKYGNGLLVVAYFIPGVRHIMGYFSGITEISYKRFATFSYLGAFVWSSTFISLGKVLGSRWNVYHKMITKYSIVAALIMVSVVIIVYVYRSNQVKLDSDGV